MIVQGEDIEFQLREKMKQVRRPLTDSEKRWAFAGDKGWRQELQPTGKLVFTIRTYLPGGLRTEWLESDAKSMEALLPDIVATLVAAGPLLSEQRKKREDEAKQRQIAEQTRCTLPPVPRSGFILRSPSRVSRKREFSLY